MSATTRGPYVADTSIPEFGSRDLAISIDRFAPLVCARQTGSEATNCTLHCLATAAGSLTREVCHTSQPNAHADFAMTYRLSHQKLPSGQANEATPNRTLM